MSDEDLMPWGKYSGKPMKSVPASYLLWLWDNVLYNSRAEKHQRVKSYVLENYKVIILECPDYIPANPPV